MDTFETCSNLPLVVGISTRAMFDLAEEDQVFRNDGLRAYIELQHKRERILLNPGAAFEVTRRLLSLNAVVSSPVVTVVLLSKNSPDLSLRAFHSLDHYKLSVDVASFTSGRPVAPFAKAWGLDLFLSDDDDDVRKVIAAGIAAAKLGKSLPVMADDPEDEVRIALDGDAVIFSEESDRRFREEGFESFMKYEREHAEVPMNRGPFGTTFLPKLARLREMFMKEDGTSRVRITIVTARSAPAHERVVHTLRAWKTPADEAHFVGPREKAPFLQACRAHIFFDDQERHVTRASSVVPSGLVLSSETASPGPLVPPTV